MKRLSLFIFDILALYLALILTLTVRYGRENLSYQYSIHFVPFSLIFVLWLLIFYISNLYEFSNLRNNTQFFSNFFRASIFAVALSIAFFYLIPLFGITPRTNLSIFIGFFIAIELGVRALFNALIKKGFKRSILLVGVNQHALELAKFIKENPQLGYRLSAVVDTSPESLSKDDHEFDQFGIVQGIDNIKRIIDETAIDTAIISPEAYRIPQIINVFYKSLDKDITFRNLYYFYERITGRVPLSTVNQIWFLAHLNPSNKRAFDTLKRITDVILAIILGAVTLILYPFVALLIKLGSPGPVLVKQVRLGRAEKPFTIYKFRSMIANDPNGGAEAHTGAVWTTENDPRITRVGKFLRKTRIDELPQVWNVFRNEMSFVGPRAERPEFHEKLKKDIPFYEERYLIKPGLTGWAQLKKSYYSSIDDTREKLQFDLYYIKNRSIVMDLGIILKTINTALRQAGR